MTENKNNLVDLRIKLDNAIDDGNMEEIDILLNDISDIDNDSIEPDNVEEFVKSVKREIEKGGIKMKRKVNFKRMVAIAAAIVAVVGVGVSGSSLFKQYVFSDGDKFYTLSSDSDFDENALDVIEKSIKSGEEMTVPKALTGESSSEIGIGKASDIEEKSFNSIEEAEKYLGMKVVLPKVMPDLEISAIKGSKIEFGENNSSSTIWATYGDIYTKAFGITVRKMNFEEGVSALTSTDMDEGSHGEYVSPKGYKFDKFNESDETKERTANIYFTSIGDYQYSFTFYNFSEDERRNIIDSFDLSE